MKGAAGESGYGEESVGGYLCPVPQPIGIRRRSVRPGRPVRTTPCRSSSFTNRYRADIRSRRTHSPLDSTGERTVKRVWSGCAGVVALPRTVIRLVDEVRRLPRGYARTPTIRRGISAPGPGGRDRSRPAHAPVRHSPAIAVACPACPSGGRP
jgi:hypothetical protein